MARHTNFSYLKLASLIVVLGAGGYFLANGFLSNQSQLYTDLLSQQNGQNSPLAFLKIDGLKGNSSQQNHKDEFEVAAYKLSDDNKTLVSFLSSNPASPQFMQYVASGQHIKTAIFSVPKDDGSTLQWKLSDVLLTSYRINSELVPGVASFEQLEITAKQGSFATLPAPKNEKMVEVMMTQQTQMLEQIAPAPTTTATPVQTTTPAQTSTSVLSPSPTPVAPVLNFSPLFIFPAGGNTAPTTAAGSTFSNSNSTWSDTAAGSGASSGAAWSPPSVPVFFDTSPL